MSSPEIRLKNSFREKAGVGGSTPSLATIDSHSFQIAFWIP
jgi:hypothetical protein